MIVITIKGNNLNKRKFGNFLFQINLPFTDKDHEYEKNYCWIN